MFWSRKTLTPLVFLLVVGTCGAAYGQVLVGSIRGTVTDEQGGVLPGVSVELVGPALIGGPETTVTSGKGSYRFPNLPPGEYEVTFVLTGFQTLRRQGLIVGVDTTVTANVVLKVASIEETVTVLGESPVVDVTDSGISTNWKPDMMESLPLARTCFFDLVNSTPGVWSHGGNTDASRSVAFGTSSESNIYLFDGVDTTGPDYGAGWAWLSPDVIEEIEVVGVGGKAEYGNFMGATINVVTKTGSNRFSGGGSALFQVQDLTSNNSRDYLKDLLDNRYITEDEQFPWNREKFRDLSAWIGGPIVQDKLWFFFSTWSHIDASSPVGTAPQFFTTWDDLHIFTKATAQLTENIKVQGFLDYEWFELPDALTPDLASIDTVGVEHGIAPTGSLSLTSILSSNTLMEIKYNNVGGDDAWESVTRFRGPSYYDWDTDTYSGAPWWPWYYWPSRQGLNATVSHFAEDFLAGDHDFKFGVQYSRGRSPSHSGYSAGVTYAKYTYYYYGYPYEYLYKYEQNPYGYGGANNQVSLFLDDTWTVNDRLTLNLGVRFDNNTGWIPDQPVLGVDPETFEWFETGETVAGVDDLVKWRVFSPRIGLAYALTEDGKTLLRANAGRYYDSMIHGNWSTPSPATPTWTMSWWTGSEWEVISTWLPESVTIDPKMKNPYSDQFSIGFDRELLPDFGLSFTYMEKWTEDMIGFFPESGTWDDYYQLTTVSDPYTGEPIQAYNLRGEDFPAIAITNPDMFYSRFRMFSIVGNKRMSNNWQLSASAVFAKMWGLNPRGAGRQTFSENILWNSSSSRDPNNLLNLEGRMAGDRPYSIKILGTYLFPYDIAASTNFQIQAGLPYARTAQIFGLNQGSATLATEARGDNGHRLPTAYLFDVNVEKIFRIGENSSIRARFEIFNLLNRATPTEMIDYSLVEGDNWVWGEIWPPRRAQFGLKFMF